MKMRITAIKKHYPLIIALMIGALALGRCLMLSLEQNQGHFVYALDDAYIHMALAKNFSQHGIWGVTRYGFSSSSSSLLYTLLLSACYLSFGVNEITPLVLNVIGAACICIVSYVFLRKSKMRPVSICLTLLALIFFTPLIPLIFCGLGHTFHLLISIFFVYLASRDLSSKKPGIRVSAFLLVLAPLVVMSRYEGLFLLFVVCCLFAAKRRISDALLLGGLGLLPIAIYGLISVSHGWHVLPNSILLKGRMPDLSSLRGICYALGYTAYRELLATPHLFALFVLNLFIFILRYFSQKKFWEEGQLMSMIFILITLLHLQFARTRYFHRYDAYLVALGIFALVIMLGNCFSERSAFQTNKYSKALYVILAFLVLWTFKNLTWRGFLSLRQTPQATSNIYEQQYQIGLFLKEFYSQENVALNDIGAASYLADVRILDLMGLATEAIASAKLHHFNTPAHIDRLTSKESVKIAIIYDHWHHPKLLSNWLKVGQWTISNNIVCGGRTVSFYALSASAKDNLIENLKRFSSGLPKDVVQSGEYLSHH